MSNDINDDAWMAGAAEDGAQQDERAVWSSEAEQSVLGSVMLDESAFDRISDIIKADTFWHAQHKTVWVAIAALLGAKKPADPITIYAALKGEKGAEGITLAYLYQLMSSVPSAYNVRRYAEIVVERATQRAIRAAADAAMEIAAGKGTVTEKLEAITAAFDSIQRAQLRRVPRSLRELLGPAIDRYQALSDGEIKNGWPTGIAPLDRMLNGGLSAGKVYGLAARPSVGKSSAARAMALHLASQGHPVLLLSQEMPAEEVADCAVAQLGRVDGARLQTGQFRTEDWGRITDAVHLGQDLPMMVDDDGGLTLGDIAGKARMVKGLKVLVVDYLQLSQSTLKGASTNDQVAEITKGLKQLALRMGIAILLLSQLSRKVEERADKEPILSDLRDSGAIEQDIDAAIMLWTAQEPADGQSSRLVGWKVAKHRGGRKGTFAMRFDPSIYSWSESSEPLRAAAPEKASYKTTGFK